MGDNSRIVWSDEVGDLRKNKERKNDDINVDEKKLEFFLKRVTSGKGRTAIVISNLPLNKKWCQRFAKNIKKLLGAGGAYKGDYIEIHGEQFDKLTNYLDSKSLRWKKIGG